MNELTNNLEFFPIPIEEEEIDATYQIPIDKISSLGVGFDSLSNAIHHVLNGDKAVSGIYRVTIPNGGTLAKFKDGSAYLGSVLDEAGKVGGGQARLNPLVCDPTTMFMAVALVSVEKKLDTIQETQQEILEFLKQKEKSNLQANMSFLSSILSDYKYNWNNAQYISGSHIKVLDIKQSSEQSIVFARNQIKSRMHKKQLIYSENDVKKIINKVSSEFSDYRLALYTFAMSSFAEVMLLQNYDHAYLDKVINNLENFSNEYRELYIKAFDKLENRSSKTVEKVVLNSIGSATKEVGKAIGKVPLVNKTPIDEGLVSAGKGIVKAEKKRTQRSLYSLANKRISYVRPIIDCIKSLESLYENPLELAFDDKNLYIA